ncbi:hypothetical protein LUZ60_003636 [Juncus effusus]|nr:hypothetical protein LUZ60_003636 [Juncus effusus]
MEWSNLPPELLMEIAKKLTELTDQFGFRSVCVSWRSAFRALPLCPQLPWVIFPSDSSIHFYSFFEDRINPFHLPGVGISYLYGSGSSSVFALKRQEPQFSIFVNHMFNDASISLPCATPGTSLNFRKNPPMLVWDCSDSVVVAAYSTLTISVYYYRFGDNSWSKVKSSMKVVDSATSIVFFSDRFYILKMDLHVSVLDKDTLEEISVIGCPYVYCPFEARLYKSRGEILLIVKAPWPEFNGDIRSKFYKVFCASINEKEMKWNEFSDLGDRALFVDDLHCISIEVSEGSRLRRNCVYTAQSKAVGDSKTVFNISISITELGNIEGERLLRELSNVIASPSYVCPPTWVLPSLV